MKRSKFKRKGNIVYTTQIGNTTIRICDDFCARTPEEVEKVLGDFHAAGWAIVEQTAIRAQKGGETHGSV